MQCCPLQVAATALNIPLKFSQLPDDDFQAYWREWVRDFAK